MPLDTDDILLLGLFGFGAWLMFRGQNSSPGVFSPNAPMTGSGISSDIIPYTVSGAGIAFIKQSEGFSAKPYADANGHSIGYGHFIQPSENYINLSEAQASDLLGQDLVPVENAINQYVTVPINQNQFDALADFIYNEGVGAFKGSTLLQVLNSGDYAGAAQQFQRWVYSSGQVNPALQARRQSEAGTFTS